MLVHKSNKCLFNCLSTYDFNCVVYSDLSKEKKGLKCLGILSQQMATND